RVGRLLQPRAAGRAAVVPPDGRVRDERQPLTAVELGRGRIDALDPRRDGDGRRGGALAPRAALAQRLAPLVLDDGLPRGLEVLLERLPRQRALARLGAERGAAHGEQ